MKKYAIVLVVALVLVMSFAVVASAAQQRDGEGYLPTPQEFDPTGATNQYPMGIYLPDAQSPWNYRIHSGYSKNTDACASCHATHTAVGASLLQWYTIYETCMACHDGTVSTTYNVQAGTIRGLQPTSGGLFSTANDASKSMHNVDGSVNIFAAPGGNPAMTGPDGDWTASFSCNSCHNPHGTGGNSRILHPNPNRVSQSRTVTVSNNGSGQFWLPDYALRGFGYDFIVAGATIGDYTVKFDQAAQVTYLEWNGTAPGSVTVTYTPSLRVTMEIENYLASDGPEVVKYNSGVNEFCGACHRDYNAGKGSHIQAAGVYTQAYRHPVGVLGSFNWELPDGTGLKFGEGNNGREILCLTCHYAHGADSALWTASLNTPYWAENVDSNGLAELSGSSSLKRIPNMGTCEACHQMGPANLGYNVVADAQPPVPDAAAGFVGAATCAQCHDSHYETQKDHLHTKKIAPAKNNTAFAPGKVVYDTWTAPFYANADNMGFRNFTGNISSITASQVNESGEIKLAVANVWISRTRFAEHGFLQGDKWRIRFAFPYDALTKAEKEAVDAANANGIRSRGLLYLNAQFYTGKRGPVDPVEGQETVAAAPGYAHGAWVSYSESSIWQDNCFSCHTTGFDMEKYVDHYGSTEGNVWAGNAHHDREFKTPLEAGYIADYGVTCEACHGPGAVHAEYPNKKNIVNPARLSVNRQNDACGTCHARNTNASFYSGNAAFINESGKYITTTTSRTDATTAAAYSGDPMLTPGATNQFDAGTFRMMNPGEKLTDFVQVRFNTLSNQGLPNMHRMQWQEMMGYTKATNQAIAADDSTRSLKGRLVSCNTCHDSHKYNAQGESLKQALATTCSACHAGTVNMTRAMPFIINAGGTNTQALNNQNDILNVRTHMFNVSKIDFATFNLRTGDAFDDTKLPPHDAFMDNININTSYDRGLPAFIK